MIQILYTSDHSARGTGLAGAVAGSRHGLIDQTNPGKIIGLDTLTLWGHGDQFKFCDHDAKEIVKLVGEWKKLNSGIKTLELITCNARHCTAGDPIADKIKAGMRSGILNPCRDVKVKALPITVSGKKNAWSILLAETNFKSWVYVTAPGADDSLMMQAQSLIRFEKTATGGLKSFNGDMATRADKVVRENSNRTWTMNYGYFNTLRANLVYV